MMSKLEKRLMIFAVVFVVVYLGAAVATLQFRSAPEETVSRIESADIGPGEGHLMMAELFLPMMILLAVTVSFILVRKKRIRAELAMEAREVGEYLKGEDE